MWANAQINGSLAEINWTPLQSEPASKRQDWIDLIITSAESHDEFFPAPEAYSEIDHGVEA